MATPKKTPRPVAVVKSLAKKPAKGAAAVKGGALGGDDDLDDLEVERLRRK